MNRWIPILFVGGFSAVLLLVAGCSSAGGARQSGDHGAMQGMMCPKCQTVWVAGPATSGPRHVTTLSRSPQTTCPDCDAAARSHLMDGQTTLHECPTCKVVPVQIRTHEPSRPRPS